MTVWIGEQGPNDRIHGDGFPFPANPYNRCLAEAALSYLPEGDPMEYAAAVGWQGLSSTISLGPPLQRLKM